jgi:branched-chain amino acid transport system substrate-binding protein
MKTSIWKILLLALVAALLLAACGGTPETAAPAAEEAAAPQEEAAPQEAAAPEEETAPEEAAAPMAEPIILGVPTALGSLEGAAALQAVEMAVEEVNASGGVNVGGELRPFEVVSIDTREQEAGVPVTDALSAVEKLILEDDPDVILIGAFRSEVVMASLDLVAEHQIPYMTAIAMTPALGQAILENPDQYKYVFRNGFNGVYLVQSMAQTLGFVNQEYGFTKAFIINQDVAWANGTAAGLTGAITGAGWEVVGTDAYPTGATDFSTSLAKADAAGAEVIIPVFDMPESGILVKQAQTAQSPALLLGFISPLAPGNAWDVFDGEIGGMVNFIFEIGAIPVEAAPGSVAFYNAYAAKYGEEAAIALAGHGVPPSYDQVYIIKDAIERAGTLDPDALVEAIAATDMDGAVGHITFGDDHQAIYGTDPATTSMAVAFQWVAPGKRVIVFPPSIAEGQIQLPEAAQ